MRTSRRRSPSVVMCGNIHMAALLLNTLIGNAVLPLNSSTTCKAHREVCVATHIGAPDDKETHESASTLARSMLVRVPEALVGRGCVNSTTTHATSRVQVSCWCGSSSSTCDARTNMDDVHGGGAAMWRQRGNQSNNQETTASARCFSLSVCRFFQRREVAVVEWWLHDSHLLPPV